jgi:hypothetical protein
MPQAKELNTLTIAVDPSESYAVVADKLQLARADASQATNPKRIKLALRNLIVRGSSVSNSNFVDSFVRISHAFVALLLGIVGGITGHLIRRQSIPATSNP